MFANAAKVPPKARETWRLISLGYCRKEVAEELHVSCKTVEYHMGRVHRVLGVDSDLQAALVYWNVVPSMIAKEWEQRSQAKVMAFG